MLGRLPDGRVIFVSLTIPGERVRARVIETRRGFVRAELLEVLEPAAERIIPRCPHYGICGGCHYQHLPYQQQLDIKQILRTIGRIGGLDQTFQPMVRPILNLQHRQFHLTPEGRLSFSSRSQRSLFRCTLPMQVIDRSGTPEIRPLVDESPARRHEDEVLMVLETNQPDPFGFSVEDLPVSAPAGTDGELVAVATASRSMCGCLFRSAVSFSDKPAVGAMLFLLDIYHGSTTAFWMSIGGRAFSIRHRVDGWLCRSWCFVPSFELSQCAGHGINARRGGCLTVILIHRFCW
jgi:23S rRNA (uracil1939-C5)-methyltransferase